MNTSGLRLTPVEVPAGASGVHVVHRHLIEALEKGTAFAPIPVPSKYFPEPMVQAIRQAVNLDEPVQPDTCAVLTTSGSTGNPRGVEYSQRQLFALNDFINSGAVVGKKLGAPPQWISALPTTSIGGFIVLSRAIAAGLPPIALESIAGAGAFSVEEVIEAIRQCGDAPAMISLVPTQFRRMLGTPEGTEALKKCAVVLVGGSATPTSDQIRAQDEGVPAVFTYGMTETTGGCVFSGVPGPNVTITIHDLTEVITISGPVVATGYRPDDHGDHLFAGSFTTADRGELDTAGVLHVLGRTDDIVIVNGVNISLGAIKEIIDAHPLVSDSYLLPNLTAVVALGKSGGHFEDDLRMLIAQRLGSLSVPRFLVVDSLPYLPNGKPDRQQILKLADPNLYG